MREIEPEDRVVRIAAGGAGKCLGGLRPVLAFGEFETAQVIGFGTRIALGEKTSETSCSLLKRLRNSPESRGTSSRLSRNGGRKTGTTLMR